MSTIHVKDHMGSDFEFSGETHAWSVNKFGSLEISLSGPMFDPFTGERPVVAFFCAPFCVIDRDKKLDISSCF